MKRSISYPRWAQLIVANNWILIFRGKAHSKALTQLCVFGALSSEFEYDKASCYASGVCGCTAGRSAGQGGQSLCSHCYQDRGREKACWFTIFGYS